VHAPAGASSVHPVVRVTGNFTAESPLHPAAREALLAAFDQGWADPKKQSQSSAKAAILRNQSLENIATRLGLRSDGIEILGEPALGHFLAIAGLLSNDSTLAYSSIDKGKIRAIARGHRGTVVELPVSHEGAIGGIASLNPGTVISLQLANAETGIVQDYNEFTTHQHLVAIDATASGARLALPAHWNTALFDATSWNGPAGLAILAINNSSAYSYPLPHIAPIKSPGTYSLPLLIAASVALENFQSEDARLRKYAMEKLGQIPGLEVVAPAANALPHIFSCVIAGVAGEYLVRELAQRNVDIDSGSACTPEDLQPSHVLAAMGYPTDGHLRITLHADTTQQEIDYLAKSISDVITELRR
jgi:cysteine desulfurase